MQTLRSRGLRPLTHAVLASLCFTLPACIEDVIVPPPDDDVCPPDDPWQDPVQPPYNDQSVYYDALVYAESIQPLFDAASCGVSGCHDARTPVLGFVLQAFPARGSAEMWSNLQFVSNSVDLAANPFVAEDTLMYRRATDGHAGPPISDHEALLSWLEAAAARYPRPTEIFDVVVFEGAIQPSLDAASCSVAGCHAPEAIRPTLFANPAPGSAEMRANFDEVTRLIDLNALSYQDTAFYIRATDNHAGRTVDVAGEAALESWISSALSAAQR